MVNKDYCLSQFLAFRYVFNPEMDFAEGLNRQKYVRIPNSAKTLVANAEDTDLAIKNVFRLIQNEKFGMLLPGGMDSAVLASYMPEGSDTYTFSFLGSKPKLKTVLIISIIGWKIFISLLTINLFTLSMLLTRTRIDGIHSI